MEQKRISEHHLRHVLGMMESIMRDNIGNRLTETLILGMIVAAERLIPADKMPEEGAENG